MTLKRPWQLPYKELLPSSNHRVILFYPNHNKLSYAIFTKKKKERSSPSWSANAEPANPESVDPEAADEEDEECFNADLIGTQRAE